MKLSRILGGLLALVFLPGSGAAAIWPQPIEDTVALLRSPASPQSISAHDCEADNILRRLSGCSKLINSRAVTDARLGEAYRNRGMALFSLGETERAIQDFDRALAIITDDAALYFARGTARQHLGDHEGALGDLEQSVALDPNDAASHGNLGVAWEKLGDDRKALEAYDRSLEIEPMNAIILNNRGNILARMGQRRQAIADFNRALLLDPSYASAYYNRAGEFCLEGEPVHAVADYLDAIRLGKSQRIAIADFLAGQGYLETTAGSDAEPMIEVALRQWSESACSPADARADEADKTQQRGADRFATEPGGSEENEPG